MKIKFFLMVLVFLLVLTSFVMADKIGTYEGKMNVEAENGRIIISGKGSVTHYCGNEILDAYPPYYEQCDGNDMGGESCQSLGYDSGQLACQSNCVYDTSLCSNNVNTGDSNGNRGLGGGGGSSIDDEDNGEIIYLNEGECVELWECTNWSDCKLGKQIRECADINECGTEKIKPVEERDCKIDVLNAPTSSEIIPGIVGAVTGIFGKLGLSQILVVGVFILILVISSISVYLLRILYKKK